MPPLKPYPVRKPYLYQSMKIWPGYDTAEIRTERGHEGALSTCRRVGPLVGWLCERLSGLPLFLVIPLK